MNYIHECQIPFNILRNRFVDSFLTSFLASEETSASFSMFFAYSELTIFFLPLVQLVKDINIEIKNFLLPEFPSSGSSNCRRRAILWSSCTNRFLFLGTVTMPESASAAISRASKDFALRNLTNSGINPASPIAFLASSDVPDNLNATFNANS
ncbi:hypothetical protein V8G54_001450 [Vigna mungo]|uniref:Uncharacterized protein n=1 Tax=Vigna mungo TaxID=3915 RepID=A0AAQ3SBI5_VIGMU